MSSDEGVDLVQRDSDMAWELFEVQPTHPEIAKIAHRVLAQDPRRSGMRILLAMHSKASGEPDAAREILLDVIGRRDRQFVNAARQLRDLEQDEHHHAEARRWAEIVLREDQEYWLDWMEFGAIAALAGDFEFGWKTLDDAVEHCARSEADDLPSALVRRAIFLLQSYAPPERFIPAAEEAMRADPSDEFVGVPLTWAYLHQGRFDDAEELCLRMLRLNPTEALPEIALTMIRTMRTTIDENGLSMDQVHDAGILKQYWNQQRDEQLGIDLASALDALEQVMPADLRAALRPPADDETAQNSPGDQQIAAWHDGQRPGTGSAWGLMATSG
ncbi:tetratricopeptide repeat protein [Nocardioides alcanivorans]|uniref:tetratricopeptide repeat protein n=1 Tax=Nocardioides alcanivorans TaxID=2897352 RepID=UPI001F1A545A|nr:hypothetical protein [Nocardioides alcanivorans]